MKQCQSCGTRNEAVAKFCSQCAAPLPSGAQWQDEPPIVPVFSHTEMTKSSVSGNGTPEVLLRWIQWLLRKEWIYWIGLIVACAAILTWFLRNTNL
jgi:hypothetical protein